MGKLLRTLRKSLLSFMNSETAEIEYVVLRHIEYIAGNMKSDVFGGDFKHFFVGGN